MIRYIILQLLTIKNLYLGLDIETADFVNFYSNKWNSTQKKAIIPLDTIIINYTNFLSRVKQRFFRGLSFNGEFRRNGNRRDKGSARLSN